MTRYNNISSYTRARVLHFVLHLVLQLVLHQPLGKPVFMRV